MFRGHHARDAAQKLLSLLLTKDQIDAAADAVESGDAAFARYLRLRARDLLADDYEGGDAAWVTVDENILGAQAGATVAALNVFVRTGDGWRLVAHHASPGTADPVQDVSPPPSVLH